MNCPKCGGWVDEGVHFCVRCGTPIGGEVTPGQVQPPHPPPQYPYPPQQAPPSDDASKTVLVIVVVVIVIVAAIVVFSAFMWLFIADVTQDIDDEPTTLNLASPSVTQRTIDEENRWDSTTTVNKVTPQDASVSWETVRVVLKASDGSLLMGVTPLEPDNPLKYDNGSDGKVSVEMWYFDVNGDGLLEPGDRIKFTALTDDYEGAIVEVTAEGERIGSLVLPTNFP